MEKVYKVSKMLHELMKKDPERYIDDLPYIGDRLIGTSTGLAFKIIGEAMLHPEKPIRIVDHFDHHHASRRLLEIISDLIQSNGLNHFVISYRDLTLTYLPFVKVQVETKVQVKTTVEVVV